MNTHEYVEKYLQDGVSPFLQPHVAKLVDAARQADNAFTPAAIDQDERDRERYEAGWLAGYAAADARRAPLAEAYALVIRELEALANETCDFGAMDALVLLRERAAKEGEK